MKLKTCDACGIQTSMYEEVWNLTLCQDHYAEMKGVIWSWLKSKENG